MGEISRREFIAALSAVGLTPAALAHGRSSEGVVSFAHGVASGDPLHDRIILWTRVTPRKLWEVVEGRWQIALDPRLKRIVSGGRFATDVTRDFTVKIDADCLEAGKTYYYRFESRGTHSPVGRTRTLKAGHVKSLRLAFASC